MSDDLGELYLKAIKEGPVYWARFLSALDRVGAKEAFKKVPALMSDSKSVFRIGITGPPGAGKSTLISQLIKKFRADNLSVGVLAVDPSSPFSKGAILGDRIRYSEHFLDEKVFIRSIGTRGSLGGLTGSAYLMLRAFDQFNIDVMIIETVGVGQTELEVVNVADAVLVVLVPESGDGIQAMKAGLTEIADIFVVNKADRPGAEALEMEIRNEAQYAKPGKVEVFKTNSISGDGVKNVYQEICKFKNAWNPLDRNKGTRLQAEAKALLRAELEADLDKKIKGIKKIDEIFS